MSERPAARKDIVVRDEENNHIITLIMNYLLILLAVSLAVSGLGWIYFIYFFSIGYGFGVSALAVTLAIVFKDVLTLPTALLCAVMFIFGCRLGLYLLTREKRSTEYRKILYGPDAAKKKPLFVVIVVWIFCALLYVGQVSPVAFYLANSAEGAPVNEVWTWIGAVMMAIGVLLESVADAQKKAAKKINPKKFVTTGLYKVVRCPNYLGELVIWTGSFIVCFGACCSVWQWIIAAIGYIGIVYVMFSGARRLEVRQAVTYGADPEFQEYIKKTPILLPFVPIYSVAKYEWLKA
jgi:steroid 5-alpha reductase family enzyme